MFSPQPPPRRRPNRRAASAVEFALILPFLAGLLSGVTEVGRAILVRQTLNDAARKGCRTGILPHRSNASIAQDINDILGDNSIGLTAVVCAKNSQGKYVDANGSTVNTATTPTIVIAINGASFDSNNNLLDVANSKKGDQISVKVSIPFAKVAWTPPIFLTGSSVESETLVMQRQG